MDSAKSECAPVINASVKTCSDLNDLIRAGARGGARGLREAEQGEPRVEGGALPVAGA